MAKHEMATLFTVRDLFVSQTQPPTLIHLPNPSAPHVDRRQPAAVPAIRVNAHEMPDVEDLAVLLRRMTYDGRLDREVRPRNLFADALPQQSGVILLIELTLCIVSGMNEEGVSCQRRQ